MYCPPIYNRLELPPAFVPLNGLWSHQFRQIRQQGRGNGASPPHQFIQPVTGSSRRLEEIQLGLLLAEEDMAMGRARWGEEALHAWSAAICFGSQADVYLHSSCCERKQHLNSCQRVVTRWCFLQAANLRQRWEQRGAKGGSLHQRQLAVGLSFLGPLLPLCLRAQLDVA